jgi:hypothetical protein
MWSSTRGTYENACRNLLGKTGKEEDHLEDLGANGRIILIFNI